MSSEHQPSENTALVRVGSCSFTYDERTKAFHAMSLSYSASVLLTPVFAEASALYQVIRSAVIECAAKEWGAIFTRLRPLCRDRELTGLRLSAGPLSVFIEPERCRDMREALTQAGLSPDDYMNLVTTKEPAC